MPQVIVQSGGYTYKHDLPACAGDLWFEIYSKTLALVTCVEDLYITYQPMRTDSNKKTVHKLSFYSAFQKYKVA